MKHGGRRAFESIFASWVRWSQMAKSEEGKGQLVLPLIVLLTRVGQKKKWSTSAPHDDWPSWSIIFQSS